MSLDKFADVARTIADHLRQDPHFYDDPRVQTPTGFVSFGQAVAPNELREMVRSFSSNVLLGGRATFTPYIAPQPAASGVVVVTVVADADTGTILATKSRAYREEAL